MKKIVILLLMVSSLAAFPNTVMAAENAPINTTAPTPAPAEIPAEVKVMLNRLEEIKALDKSTLSRSERKELRREVRTIKKDLRAAGNGLYISSGAIIIILLLIIIL
ncbi:hypothetical protein CJ739_3756 [Mariniflexile rhizosphaerae]|uniref:hypothetical protein n=1 Tax=unclassified Mariniflexile TaxID=2643887 RepID=UPI000CAEB690|nr:hypothetical protein [Mariniflexile sp. TRM1-10]AXP82816.1 hypothetical protein CJ739_3756 [Mariniflexile sp. TRM1-10]PLB19074.1 MAG: hypothetical protein TRG1_2101 [Flavobacteriaceae bacterium FS1-H7996/R]